MARRGGAQGDVLTPPADGATPRQVRHLSISAADLRAVRLLDGSDFEGGVRSNRTERFTPVVVVGVLAVVTTGVVAWWIATLYRGVDLTEWVDNVTEGAAALIASLSCLYSARRRRGRARTSLFLLAAATLSWSFGEGAYTYLSTSLPSNTVPFPSAADYGFLAAIPLLLLGIVTFPVDSATTLSRLRISLDGVVVAASLLTVCWAAVLNTYFSTAHEPTLKAAVGLAYPLSDLAIATIALISLARSGRSRRIPLLLMVLTMLSLGLADSGFFYYTSTNSYPADATTDAGWIAGFFLLALAALWPQRNADPEDTKSSASLWQLVIPYFLLAAAVATDVVEYALHRSIGGFLSVDGLVLIGAVLIRQVIILVENHRLNQTLQSAIETLRSEEAELSRLALHDPLTGLANRLLFTERLDAALSLAAAGQRRVAVIFCDLDGFKDANDSLGHAAGDAMLIGVSERLLACVRPEDTVGRLGGDEFAIVLEDLDDLSDASRVAARIVETMREPLAVAGERFLLHVSIGIALASEGSYGIEELLRDADIALYAAKNAGGNRYRMFDSSMGTAYLDRLRLESDLSGALERNELFLEYQPIVDLRTDAAIGVEALLRWRHPTRGLLQPAAFLTTAERSGSIVAIGKWVLEASLNQLRGWQSEMLLPPDFSIAVNLSVRQLEAGDLVASLENAIATSGVDPRLVRLELTETSLIDRAEASIDLLHALRRLGVHLEIDDFGTGYSSLDYLRRLPLDILKIDQSFISGLGSDPHDTLIVETIINLAHALGMTVVAEGVETPLQLARLRSLNCDFGQGFFWSRSLPPDALAEWISRPSVAGASGAPAVTARAE